MATPKTTSTETTTEKLKPTALVDIISQSGDALLESRAQDTALQMKIGANMTMSSLEQKIASTKLSITQHLDIARTDANSLMPVNTAKTDKWFAELAALEDQLRIMTDSYNSYKKSYERLFGPYVSTAV